jgi:hypothetical protein
LYCSDIASMGKVTALKALAEIGERGHCESVNCI